MRFGLRYGSQVAHKVPTDNNCILQRHSFVILGLANSSFSFLWIDQCSTQENSIIYTNHHLIKTIIIKQNISWNLGACDSSISAYCENFHYIISQWATVLFLLIVLSLFFSLSVKMVDPNPPLYDSFKYLEHVYSKYKLETYSNSLIQASWITVPHTSIASRFEHFTFWNDSMSLPFLY